ncbi:MAG: AAA domain-containing protein [Flavobacteriales bacterium]
MKPFSVIEDELYEFEIELSRFNQTDVLVNLNKDQAHSYNGPEEALTPTLLGLLRDASRKEREEGIYPLCLSEGLLVFHRVEKVQHIPLFIHLLKPKPNPLLSTVFWDIEEEDWMVNPYLIQLLAFEETDLLEKPKSEVISTLVGMGYTVEVGVRYLGNFHPYRHALLKEVLELRKKKDFAPFEFLFDGNQRITLDLNTEFYPTLFPCDQSQVEALRLAERSSMVIQGPPGTGKSQVITNLIGRFLLKEKYVLICSQKRQALEVVAEKLQACGLGDLTLIKSSTDSVKSIVGSLKKSWQTLEQADIPRQSAGIQSYKQNWFQSQLDTFHKAGLIGPYSPKEFLTITGYHPRHKTPFISGLPSVDKWSQFKSFLAPIPYEVVRVLGHLNPGLTLQSSFELYHKQWKILSKELKALGWESLTYSQISEKQHQTHWVQLFSNELALRCLPWMSHRKKIDRLMQQVKETDEKLNQSEPELRAWKITPTVMELSGLEGHFTSNSWKKRWSIRKAKNRWLRDPSTDLHALILATKTHFEFIQSREETLVKLIKIGLTDPTTDLTAYRTFCSLYDGNLYQSYEKLPVTERLFLQQHQTLIQKVVRTINHFFTIEPHEVVSEVINPLLVLELIIPHLSAWEKIPPAYRSVIGTFSDIQALEKAIISTDWQRFTAYFPAMHDFVFSSQEHLLEEIEEHNKSNQGELVALILSRRKEKFDAYHTLLATPKGQLTAADQSLKKRLQKGKRIVAKLFMRQRNFASLKSLLDQDVMLWVRVLKPLWFSSPENLAMDIPLAAQWFDASIIDEASQLLLSHSFGTLYRSSHLIVAGDEMQMAPSTFFTSGSNEGITLLDQASFNLPKHRLNFHYRSQQPPLIQFSNLHFYQNKLTILPTYPPEKAIYSLYAPENVYSDGVNLGEAASARQLLLERIEVSQNRIGLVAFSEKQLKVILRCFTLAERHKLDIAQAEGQLFLKTLDQIQGDECDEMIISFGYGKKQGGTFDLRFGPLNQEGGDKRLNVLFSRAKKRLYFLHSVRSSDFPISENPGMHTLKKWFEFMEDPEVSQDSKTLPLASVLNAKEQNLYIHRWIDISHSLFDIITYRMVLKNRGWIMEEVAFSAEQDRTRVLPLDGIVRSA